MLHGERCVVHLQHHDRPTTAICVQFHDRHCWDVYCGFCVSTCILNYWGSKKHLPLHRLWMTTRIFKQTLIEELSCVDNKMATDTRNMLCCVLLPHYYATAIANICATANMQFEMRVSDVDVYNVVYNLQRLLCEIGNLLCTSRLYNHCHSNISLRLCKALYLKYRQRLIIRHIHNYDMESLWYRNALFPFIESTHFSNISRIYCIHVPRLVWPYLEDGPALVSRLSVHHRNEIRLHQQQQPCLSSPVIYWFVLSCLALCLGVSIYVLSGLPLQ